MEPLRCGEGASCLPACVSCVNSTLPGSASCSSLCSPAGPDPYPTVDYGLVSDGMEGAEQQQGVAETPQLRYTAHDIPSRFSTPRCVCVCAA